jgi:peptidoglycan/xylan/chitin deacetylase (PgdA/CDA1 family)
VVLKTIKQSVLGSARGCGVFSLVRNSRWRQNRLLILAYHGIAIADEHQWKPTLFLHPERFRDRLRLIEQAGCTVLPLHEALHRLYANDLPERSVALTFDDGTYDFYQQAYPILKEFGFPATVYLTTFYADYNRPVFDVIASYMLWKRRGGSVNMKTVTGRDVRHDLGDESARNRVVRDLHAFAGLHRLSAEEKDELIIRLAEAAGVDHGEILDRRILHIMRAGEVAAVASGGIDIQLHTHRHRTPSDRTLFLREIDDNRTRIEAMTGSRPTHFCYPSGVYEDAFLPWLKEAGVESATTCDPGIATEGSDPLLLPRLVDSSTLSPVEFEGWLAGVAGMLPHRARA